MTTPITECGVSRELLTTLGAIDHVNHYDAREAGMDIRVKEAG